MATKSKKKPLNIGIVGGGRACVYFLDLLETTFFPYLDLKILGVCDINVEAEGMIKAKKMGIPIFKNIVQLDSISAMFCKYCLDQIKYSIRKKTVRP